MSMCALSALQPGQQAQIIKVDDNEDELRGRLDALGFRAGATVGVLYSALMGDPKTYVICGSQVSLRKNEASHVFVNQ